MKYVVDRIEENFAVLENLETREKLEVELLALPIVKEGTVLVYEDNLYRIDDKAREERVNLIREKLNKLKRKDT